MEFTIEGEFHIILGEIQPIPKWSHCRGIQPPSIVNGIHDRRGLYFTTMGSPGNGLYFPHNDVEWCWRSTYDMHGISIYLAFLYTCTLHSLYYIKLKYIKSKKYEEIMWFQITMIASSLMDLFGRNLERKLRLVISL